jgi:peptidoglycan hydrolase-like protein with peptidoglycan-binding domain
MDNHELQRRLAELDFYRGKINGKAGLGTMQAIAAFLNNGRVNVLQSWTKARKVMAAKQLLCRRENIEVGSIDGLYGPQTKFAFAVYAERHTGGPSTEIAERNIDDAAIAEPTGVSPVWPRQAEVEAFFGPKGVDQVRLVLPFPMRLAWDLSKVVNSFSVHSKVHASAERCFQRIAQSYNQEKRRALGLDLFGGCLNVRKMQGGNNWSMHSWGIAIDFDPERNGLHSNRGNARLAEPDCETFWRIWEDEGWLSLGRTRNYDWMHVQAARL